MKSIVVSLCLVFVLPCTATVTFAFDWTQPILDENGKVIPDCQGKEPCDKVLSVGMLTGRALLASPTDPHLPRETPEQKWLEGNLGLQIILHPDLGPTPDELKMACDAVGSIPSRLAVARGWALLGCRTSVK